MVLHELTVALFLGLEGIAKAFCPRRTDIFPTDTEEIEDENTLGYFKSSVQ